MAQLLHRHSNEFYEVHEELYVSSGWAVNVVYTCETGTHDKKMAIEMGATLKLALSVLVPIYIVAREDTLKLRLGVAPRASQLVLPQSCRIPRDRPGPD